MTPCWRSYSLTLFQASCSMVWPRHITEPSAFALTMKSQPPPTLACPGQQRGLVPGYAGDLRELLVVRLQRLRLARLAFRNPARIGLTRADIVAVALDQPGRVGDGSIPRLARLRRPVARERAGFRRSCLVAGGERLRQSDPGGRDAAGGGPGIGNWRSVARHGERRPRGRVAREPVGVDMGRGADLPALQGREAVRVVAGVGEREVAGRALMGGGRGGVLTYGEHRGRQHGRFRQPVGERGGEERHRHREVSRHHRDIGRHRPDPRLGHQRDADIAAGHEGGGLHPFGCLAHRDAVQHRVERTPTLQPDQPRHIRPEDRRARRGQHQQYRHWEGPDIEALEDDPQQRNPGLGLSADRPVSRDGLRLRPRLGVGPERGGVARFRRPLLARVMDRVQHHLLAHDLARRARRPYQEVMGGRERRQQLGPRQRVGPRIGEDAPPRTRCRRGRSRRSTGR